MRRKEKYIINGALLGIGITSLIDILLQWNEHKNRGENFTWKSYDGSRTIKNSLKGGLAGASLGYLYYKHKTSEESKLNFNPDKYLKKILRSESLKEKPELLGNALKFKAEIKTFLSNKYANILASEPEDTGSFVKGTANNSSFDLDIILPFKSTSFNSLEEMYTHTYETLKDRYSFIASIQKQTKAISIVFENEFDFLNFDIVPGREINNYKIDKELNLYIRPDWIWQRGSSFKTNIWSQKSLIKSKPAIKQSIRLMKLYVERNDFEIPKIIIEQGVKEALSTKKFGIHSSQTENLLNCMVYLSEFIKKQTVLDYANSNNNLSSKITEQNKNSLSNQLIFDVERIEVTPRYIREIFEI